MRHTISNTPFGRPYFTRKLNEQRAWALVINTTNADTRLFLPGTCVTCDEIAIAATADLGTYLKFQGNGVENHKLLGVMPDSMFAEVTMARYLSKGPLMDRRQTDELEVWVGLVDECLDQLVDWVDSQFMRSIELGGCFEVVEVAGSTIE